MKVLVFVDDINCFSNKNCVKESVEIICVSEDIDKLKEVRELCELDCGIKWEECEGENNWIGYCLYGEEVEKKQYYRIVDVEEL